MPTDTAPSTLAPAAGALNAAVNDAGGGVGEGAGVAVPLPTVIARVAVAEPVAVETVSFSVCAPFGALVVFHENQNVVPVVVFVAMTAPSRLKVNVFDVPHWFDAIPTETLFFTVAPVAGALNDAVRPVAGGGVPVEKVAVTVVAALTVTRHGDVPVQPPPLQPANAEPLTGAAVRVTRVPIAYAWAQSDPQVMPDGLAVTVPVPPPLRTTESVAVGDDAAG